MTDPLVGIDRVPWHGLHHAFGPAHDVPDQLRALRSTDADVRRWARASLSGNVIHQGTRWQASKYVVPFLVALIDDPATPERPALLGLLQTLLVGDRTDQDLPFDIAAATPLADSVTAGDVAEVLSWLYDEEAEPTCDGEAVAQHWERGAYLAGTRYAHRFVAWLDDPDTEVAAAAAELLAWYPDTPGGVDALVGVPCTRPPVRAGANLALGHLPADELPQLDLALADLLHSEGPGIRQTAAVALAYRMSKQLPDEALDLLSAPELFDGEVPPWPRSLAGFRTLALQRVGLTT